MAKKSDHAVMRKAPRRISSAQSVSWSAPEPFDASKLPKLARLQVFGVDDVDQLLGELAHCRHLTELELSDCQIAELPAAIFALAELRALDLAHNDLQSIPAEIARLERLTTLVLSDNPMTHIAPELASMTALEHLHLGGSIYNPAPLTRLPALEELPRLETLSLSDLPSLESARLDRMPALATLELGGDVTLRGVPEELESLTRLRALAFRSSKLTALPDAVRALTHLEGLSVAYSAFTTLPDWLVELPRLRSLSVIGAQAIDPDALVALVAKLPALDRIEVYFPFPAKQRKALTKAGLTPLRANPSLFLRGEQMSDPFHWIR
jgi:Leucine-rich repeat (LRR) protein